MDRRFSQAILYSTIMHILLLMLFIWIYESFLVTRTPLLMQLTLIGQMSQGEGLGAPSAQPGQTAGALPTAKTEGDFSTPQQAQANPAVSNSAKPEVAIHHPLKPRPHSSAKTAEQYLESLRKSAPIGLNPKKEVDSTIETTAGLAQAGVAGTPNGNANIEGELAARNIKHQVNPAYPDWAKKQGVEATIRFRITVLPSGLLKDDLELVQTSGYRELDRVVYDALIQWEFEPLASQVPQVEQTGVITFSFSLKNP
jgi:TonB family protein